MKSNRNHGKYDSDIDFRSFLSALSGQENVDIPSPPKGKKTAHLSPSDVKTPRRRLIRKGGETHKILKKEFLKYKKPLPPRGTVETRESKKIVTTGKGEETRFLMGTRQKAPRMPLTPETQFLPQDEITSIREKKVRYTAKTKPSKGVVKAPDTEKLEEEVPFTRSKPPKKEEKIKLSHISIKPQFTLEQLLETMIRENASDLHVSTQSVPTLRIDGEIVPLDLPDLDEETTENLLLPLLSDELRTVFEEEGEVDFSFDYLDKARFRINYFRHHWGIGGVFRLIPLEIPNMQQLGLPPVLKNLLKFKKGLILVAGPSGSGKSTTIASMLNEINQTRKLRIITLERPIEYVIKSKMSLVSQREIGSNALSYSDALWAILREDPDVIMLSELWETEDIRQVLKISETGHLVITSIHTTDCAKAVESLVASFPQEEQAQIRIALSECLIGVIAQRLIPRADGRGRALACEILLSTTGLATIIRDGKFYQIPTIIQSGGGLGMQTMDQALVELIEKRLITPQSAKIYVTDDRFFRRAGIRFDD